MILRTAHSSLITILQIPFLNHDTALHTREFIRQEANLLFRREPACYWLSREQESVMWRYVDWVCVEILKFKLTTTQNSIFVISTMILLRFIHKIILFIYLLWPCELCLASEFRIMTCPRNVKNVISLKCLKTWYFIINTFSWFFVLMVYSAIRNEEFNKTEIIKICSAVLELKIV